jgi:hypothetical protein
MLGPHKQRALIINNYWHRPEYEEIEYNIGKLYRASGKFSLMRVSIETRMDEWCFPSYMRLVGVIEFAQPWRSAGRHLERITVICFFCESTESTTVLQSDIVRDYVEWQRSGLRDCKKNALQSNGR